jgi:hypothetical protein
MIPYDLDPSLHAAAPASAMLDDGFSPPQQLGAGESEQPDDAPSVPGDPALSVKSPF